MHTESHFVVRSAFNAGYLLADIEWKYKRSITQLVIALLLAIGDNAFMIHIWRQYDVGFFVVKCVIELLVVGFSLLAVLMYRRFRLYVRQDAYAILTPGE